MSQPEFRNPTHDELFRIVYAPPVIKGVATTPVVQLNSIPVKVPVLPACDPTDAPTLMSLIQEHRTAILITTICAVALGGYIYYLHDQDRKRKLHH